MLREVDGQAHGCDTGAKCAALLAQGFRIRGGETASEKGMVQFRQSGLAACGFDKGNESLRSGFGSGVCHERDNIKILSDCNKNLQTIFMPAFELSGRAARPYGKYMKVFVAIRLEIDTVYA